LWWTRIFCVSLAYVRWSELTRLVTRISPPCMPTLPFNGKLPRLVHGRVRLTFSTWEGDNTILSLQAGRSLVGAWGGTLALTLVLTELTSSRNQGQAPCARCPLPRYQGYPYRQIRFIPLSRRHHPSLQLRGRQCRQEGCRRVCRPH
jgi:hypothetical protein